VCELNGPELPEFDDSAEGRALRRSVHRLDKLALGEARKLFATSANVADRLERSTGLEAEVLPHPPQELPYRCDEYGDFILSVGRIDRAKRVELLIDALGADASRPGGRGSCASPRRSRWPRPLRGFGITPTRPESGARRASAPPSNSPGTPQSTACWREGRVLLAPAARAVGNRRLQRAPAAGA